MPNDDDKNQEEDYTRKVMKARNLEQIGNLDAGRRKERETIRKAEDE